MGGSGLVLAVVAALPVAASAMAAPRGFPDALGTLAERRSAGEQRAALLKQYRPRDLDGQRLYAEAKAGFDGAIAALGGELMERRAHPSAAAAARLADAEARARAFARHTRETLRDAVPPGSKAAITLHFQDGGDDARPPAPLAAGSGRAAMGARIEQERWRPWGDIPAAR